MFESLLIYSYISNIVGTAGNCFNWLGSARSYKCNLGSDTTHSSDVQIYSEVQTVLLLVKIIKKY